MKWIKAHQDTDKAGNRIIGPLMREVQMNCIADGLAKVGAKTATTQQQTQHAVLSTTKIAFYDTDNTFINNIRTYIIETTNGEKLKEYN